MVQFTYSGHNTRRGEILMFVWLRMKPVRNLFTNRAHYFFIGMLFLGLGVNLVISAPGKADDADNSRKELWKSIERSLNEGKPKTAAQLW